MTGWDIVSLIVLVAIAWFFLRVQLADLVETLRGRRRSVSPRSLEASGGYQAQPPPLSRMQRNAPADPPAGNERPWRREQPVQAPAGRRRNTGIGTQVRRQLRSPESAKMAFVMREVLDTPIGMRDEE